MKLQLLQPRTGVRSRPFSSALALCKIAPANNAINNVALRSASFAFYYSGGIKTTTGVQAMHVYLRDDPDDRIRRLLRHLILAQRIHHLLCVS